MAATGLRNILSLAGRITDSLTARAIQQLEDRYKDLLRHGHEVFTSLKDGFVPAPGASTPSTYVLQANKVWAAQTGGGGGVSNGDKGDITVAGEPGTPSWTIDPNVVSNTKLRDSSGVSVIGRSANSSGDPEDIAAGADGDVLRRAAGVLGFGAIPESSVTNLTTDLAGKASITSLARGAYVPGAFTLATGQYGVVVDLLALVSTDVATLEGTAILVIGLT
jgi:hypothetical protein